MYSKKELEKQEKDIRKYVGLIMLPIVGLIILFSKFQPPPPTDELLKKCDDIYLSHYSGVIVDKLSDRWQQRQRPILLDDGNEKIIWWNIYEKLEVGDYVEKEPNSDFVCYYTKKHGLIEDDVNDYNRKKYLESLNK